MFRRFLDVTFPDTYHAITARLHIGILRLIEGNAAGLAMVKGGELIGLAMPVVTIELNNQVSRGYEGINAELVTDKVLSFIGNADAVKNSVGGAFKVVRLHAELLGIHAAQHDLTFGVFVATLRGAVSNGVFSVLDAGRRPIKSLAAYLADVFGLVAALPFVSTFDRTEAAFVRSSVERDAAYFARGILALPALWSGRLAVTLKRAVVLIGAQMTCDNFATAIACNRLDLVFVLSHDYILTQLNQHD